MDDCNISLPEDKVKRFQDNKALQVSEASIKPHKYQRLNSAEKYFRYNSIPKGLIKRGDFFSDVEKTSYKVKMAIDGRLAKLSRGLGHKPDGLGKSRGDVVDGFSRESRNRLLQMLLSVNYAAMGMPLFYTLTYPGDYPRDPKVWKTDLNVLNHRLQRASKDFCEVWKLEEQTRGAPHYCGLLWGFEGLKTREGKEWFSRQWYEVVGSGDERHLKAGTGLDEVKALPEIINYIAKYMRKDTQTFDYPVGRYWGVANRKKLSIKYEEFEIDRMIYFQMKRIAKRYLKARQTRNQFNEVIKGKENGLWVRWDNALTMKVIESIVRGIEKGERYEEMEVEAEVARKPVGKMAAADPCE